MPDPLKKTISGTQASGLFNKSPYVTRWMLYQWLKTGADIDPGEENERMEWGKRLEPAIIEATAERMKLEFERWDQDKYCRRGLLGCTKDALIYDPQRGPGAIEVKNVDWLVWKKEWSDTRAPFHIETQIQTQMHVGDESIPYSWGVIACLIGGNELRLYPRELIPSMTQQIEAEAEKLFFEVEKDIEPDPFGNPREIEILNRVYPWDKIPEVKVAEYLDNEDLAKVIAEYDRARLNKGYYTKLEKEAKARVLCAAKDATKVMAPGVNLFVDRRTNKNGVQSVVLKTEYYSEQEDKIDAEAIKQSWYEAQAPL